MICFEKKSDAKIYIWCLLKTHIYTRKQIVSITYSKIIDHSKIIDLKEVEMIKTGTSQTNRVANFGFDKKYAN